MRRIFEGIRVLDFSNNVAGPEAASLLADYGAEVIKIEKPIFGDDSRAWDVYEVPICYPWYNRGKKSVTISTKDPRGIELCKKMIAEADVVIEAFRPGTMKKLGLDYDSVVAFNPNIIYLSVSAFGQTGPMWSKPGYDLLAQGYSGWADTCGEPDGVPTRAGASLGDHVAGLNAFATIAAALYHRKNTGEGQYIDIALLDCLFSFNDFFEMASTGNGNPTRSGRFDSLAPLVGMFHGKGNQYVMISCANFKLIKIMLGVIGRPELLDDPRFISYEACTKDENRIALNQMAEDWLATFDDINIAVDIMDKAGVPCSKVKTAVELVNDEQLIARGAITDLPMPNYIQEKGIKSIKARGPWHHFSKCEVKMGKSAALGEHNVEVLTKYGLTKDEVEELEAEWNATK